MRILLTSLLLLAAMPAFAGPTVITIDVPGARFTNAGAISPSGIVAGSYEPKTFDPCGLECGFVRMPDGAITTFPVFDSFIVAPSAVLDDATIAGSYRKGHSFRGFIRAPSGGLTDIFFRNADTMVAGMTTSGIVGGTVGGLADHAFLRMPDGEAELLKMKGCSFASANSFNEAGTLAGSCFHKDKLVSYLRTLDGTVTFVKHAGWESLGISAIDDTGAVAGSYADKQTGARHGYIRNAAGGFRSFELPGDNPVNTYIIAMTVVGGDRQIAGWFDASNGHDFGFVHHSNGTADEIFDVSGAQGSQSGTVVSGISPTGAIVGSYFDDGVGVHGYIRTP